MPSNELRFFEDIVSRNDIRKLLDNKSGRSGDAEKIKGMKWLLADISKGPSQYLLYSCCYYSPPPLMLRVHTLTDLVWWTYCIGTVGNNSSELFADVVKLVSTKHMELKKLVYMYVESVVTLAFGCICLLFGIFLFLYLTYSLQFN